jgi:hypothetical protein
MALLKVHKKVNMMVMVLAQLKVNKKANMKVNLMAMALLVVVLSVGFRVGRCLVLV